jgi:hypothetical protein
MKLGLPFIVVIAAIVGAGAGAGVRIALPQSAPGLNSDSAADNEEPSAPEAVEQKRGGTPNHPETDEKKKSGDGKHKQQAVAGAYFKFSRQFVAPVVRDGAPAAMIVLDVMLEMSPDAAAGNYANEPKLRDAVLRALLTQSANGELKGMLSDPSLLEATREAILKNVQEVIGDQALAVLLLDVAYQPF